MAAEKKVDTTGLLGWIDHRFPATVLWKRDVAEYYAPKNFNFWYIFGSLAMLVLVVALKLLLDRFFASQLGLALRATGANGRMARAQGVNTGNAVLLGMAISNALVGLAGALFAQSQGGADISMGIGTIVIGLASVIIGEVLFGADGFLKLLFGANGFLICLISVILGSVVYRAVIALVLEMGMPPNDLKLFTAILVGAALALPLLQKKLQTARKAVK